MPALFEIGSYDLAGYNVGVLEYGNELSTNLSEGDLVIGVPSSGLHCSGFNLINDIMNKLGVSYNDVAPFNKYGLTYGNISSTCVHPHNIYLIFRF